MKKILVTGGAGLQGSHLVEELLKEGYQVYVLNTPSEHAMNNYVKYLRPHDNVIMVWGTVADKHLVDSILNNGIDVVFHLGAKINVDESITDPIEFYLVNIIGTHNVLESCVQHKARLIMASTCEVYGENTNPPWPMSEDHPLRPFSPYAMSKCAADRMCFAYHRTYGLDVTILRPFNIYGPRQKAHGKGAVIPIFFRKALADEDITIHGDGLQTRDYLNVHDVVQGYLTVLHSEEVSGEVFNVGSGEEHSIIEIASMVVDLVGKGRIVHVDGRPGEVSSFTCDNSKIKALGWEQSISFSEGMLKYYKWLNCNG